MNIVLKNYQKKQQPNPEKKTSKWQQTKMKTLTICSPQLLHDKIFGDSPLKKGSCGLVTIDLINWFKLESI